MKIKVKDIIVMLLSVAATVSILFLPFLSVGSVSFSLVDLTSKLSQAPTGVPLILGIDGYLLIAAVAGSVLAILFALFRKRIVTLICSLIGIISLGVFILRAAATVAPSVEFPNSPNFLQMLGFGVWIFLAAHVVNVVLCCFGAKSRR